MPRCDENWNDGSENKIKFKMLKTTPLTVGELDANQKKMDK